MASPIRPTLLALALVGSLCAACGGKTLTEGSGSSSSDGSSGMTGGSSGGSPGVAGGSSGAGVSGGSSGAPSGGTSGSSSGGSSDCPDIPTLLGSMTCSAVACHNATFKVQNLDLQSPDVAARLVGVPSTEGPGLLIDPSNPSASVLYTKLTAMPPFGARMPMMPFDDPLDSATMACVLAWVTQQGGSAACVEPQPHCASCMGSPPILPNCQQGQWVCPPAGPCASPPIDASCAGLCNEAGADG